MVLTCGMCCGAFVSERREATAMTIQYISCCCLPCTCCNCCCCSCGRISPSEVNDCVERELRQ